MLIRALQAAAGNFGVAAGYTIDNSLRFNDNDSAYLSRTPSVASNRKTFTWSGWVKRGNLSGVRQGIFTKTNPAGNTYWAIEFATNDTINVYDSNVGGSTAVFSTNAVFRDVSGWYHIVVAIDTTQATSTNRAKLYINGVQITSFTAVNYPSLNSDTVINLAEQHSIGSWQPLTGAGYYFDGYMAEINFIDGQALTADDFGEISETTGEWSPKAYAGTYGTNGFYLPFDGNANDSSGNGNNWTENNLASTDYMIDTPTNNFCTLNPLYKSSEITLQEANLTLTNTSATSVVTSTFTAPKYYYEIVLGSLPVNSFIGIISDLEFNSYVVYGINGYGFLSVGFGSPTNTISGSGSVGDIIGVAVDVNSGTIELYKNNVSMGVMSNITFGSSFYNSFSFNNTVSTPWRFNFGADSSFAGNKTRQGNTDANGIGDFYYAPPTGYLALCTDNLPAPAIEQPETQFNVVTYTGDGTSSNAITGVGFQPDFVWIKQRNSTASHQLQDSVRGAGKILFSNDTSVEQSYNTITSFDSDGFTVAVDGIATGTNASGGTYVAWCWKAGGTAASNTDGSITSQVSANVDAGFSVVSYTGNLTSGATIGHGLSNAPSVVIVKNRNTTANWHVYTKATGANNVLLLDTDAALYTSNSVWWNNTDPSSTVVTLGSGTGTNNSNAMIAYCFHSVEGFSKFGSYVGNGSATNPPFVYTGFKPAFVMVKASSTTGSWCMFDDARNTYNEVNELLNAEVSDAEYVNVGGLDFLSNGFKQRNTNSNRNSSGTTYIYMAFAEHPTKFSLGR